MISRLLRYISLVCLLVFPGLTDLQMKAEPQKNNNRRTTKTQPRTSQKKQEKPKPAKEKKVDKNRDISGHKEKTGIIQHRRAIYDKL